MTAIEQIFENRALNDMIRVPAPEEQISYGNLRDRVGIRDSTLHRYLRALEEHSVVIADLAKPAPGSRCAVFHPPLPSGISRASVDGIPLRSGRRVACLPG